MLKKNREAQGLFIAEGVKVVEEMLQAAIVVNEIFATSSFLEKNSILLKQKGVAYFEVSSEELKRISALITPNEVLALCQIPAIAIKPELLVNQLSLVLDDIKDPGNLGTIIRIADWFGITHLICSEATVDAFNPKVVQATMGSIARVNLYYTDLFVFFKQMKQLAADKLKDDYLPVYGAMLTGENIYKQQLPTNALIVIGNESRGITETLLPFITHKIKIPAFGKANRPTAESLNAAIATSIICSEFTRNST